MVASAQVEVGSLQSLIESAPYALKTVHMPERQWQIALVEPFAVPVSSAGPYAAPPIPPPGLESSRRPVIDGEKKYSPPVVVTQGAVTRCGFLPGKLKNRSFVT